MKTICRRNVIVAFLSTLIACLPPPPPTQTLPELPPAYGSDPYQTSSSVPPVTPTVAGLNMPLTPVLTQKEAAAYITMTLDERQVDLTGGFSFEGEIFSDKVSAGEEKSFAVSATKDNCLRIIAASDPGIPHIDLYLYDGKNLLDRDIAPDNYPVVSSCFDEDKEVKLVLKVMKGTGWFGIRVFAKANDGTVKKTMEAVESPP